MKTDDVLVVMGDFNAQLGKTKYNNISGIYGLGERNPRGDRLINICEENDLWISNTHFKHHPRRLYTWISPGDRTRHQLDFVMIRQRYKNSITQCKTYPGADVGSDHNPVIARITVKLKKPDQRSNDTSLGKLPASAFTENFMVEVKKPVRSSSE